MHLMCPAGDRRPTARPGRRSLLTGLLGAGALAACSNPAKPTSAPTSAPTGAAGAPVPAGAGSTASPPPPASTRSGASPSATPSASPSAGPDITRGPVSATGVALTFHGAGTQAQLSAMLAALKEQDARVTVLAIGSWLAGEPAMAKQILDAGHELGNHTWSHRTMTRLSANQTSTEIDRAAAELRSLTGSQGRWFRPSGTPHSTALIRAAAVRAGYGACLGYDLDPLDYTDPGPAAILRAFRAGLKPGAIVSLHLGHEGTIHAMPAMLGELKHRSLTAVTASDLLVAA